MRVAGRKENILMLSRKAQIAFTRAEIQSSDDGKSI
jgi:hypothetical protein